MNAACPTWSAASLRVHAGLDGVRLYARLSSTNQRAAELLERGALRLPAAVVASRQTAGRGRGGNTWFTDAGSLAVTFVLPAEARRAPQELPLRAGLAALDAVARFVSARRLAVKWPNDLLADGRKLAGILCERVREADLIGIGLNVTTDLATAPPDVARRAVSLAQLTSTPPTRAQVFVELAAALLHVWSSDDWLERLNRVHALTGRHIAVQTDEQTVRGVCRGIDAQGRLLLDDGARVQAILSGTVL